MSARISIFLINSFTFSLFETQGVVSNFSVISEILSLLSLNRISCNPNVALRISSAIGTRLCSPSPVDFPEEGGSAGP